MQFYCLANSYRVQLCEFLVGLSIYKVRRPEKIDLAEMRILSGAPHPYYSYHFYFHLLLFASTNFIEE